VQARVGMTEWRGQVVDPSVVIDERVDVYVVYRKSGSANAVAFPQKMQYRNKVVKFTELGMRHPTEQGKRMIHVFDMSDGTNDYRLEFDAERLVWKLKTIIYGT